MKPGAGLRDGARALGRALLDAWLPVPCVLCGGAARAMGGGAIAAWCTACDGALPWWRAVDGCPRCGTWPEPGVSACPGCLAAGSPLHRCIAALRYEGPTRRWLPAYKRRRSGLGPPIALTRTVDGLAEALALTARARLPDPPDLVLPLPIHPRRRRARGFNQADRIARGIARAMERPLAAGHLIRTRDTPPQAALRGEARRQNVRGAFRVRRPLPEGRVIAIVDDVLTTGHSLEAAADALLEAGAREVVGLTIAATLPAAARRPRPAAGAAGPAGPAGGPYAPRPHDGPHASVPD